MSNKERITDLETSLGVMQDEIQKMSIGVTEKFRSIEETMTRLMEAVTTNGDGGGGVQRSARRSEGSHHINQNMGADTVHTNPFYQPRPVKLTFPQFSGGDSTQWLSKVKQYFSYQETPLDHQVPYASYHLEDEANEWWQATSKALGEDNVKITWLIFEEELWARFGPTDGDDFDEALSKIQQTGSLRDYQREFERLQNKVCGWSQKALVGTYIGGLSPSISDHIRMFEPRSLKRVIMLARMRDEQIQRQKKQLLENSISSHPYTSSSISTRQPNNQYESLGTPKKLSWDEMKKKRSLGLCFSCDERYFPGHKCKQPHLFVMESEHDDDEVDNIMNLEDKVLLHDRGIDALAQVKGKPQGVDLWNKHMCK